VKAAAVGARAEEEVPPVMAVEAVAMVEVCLGEEMTEVVAMAGELMEADDLGEAEGATRVVVLPEVEEALVAGLSASQGGNAEVGTMAARRGGAEMVVALEARMAEAISAERAAEAGGKEAQPAAADLAGVSTEADTEAMGETVEAWGEALVVEALGEGTVGSAGG